MRKTLKCAAAAMFAALLLAWTLPAGADIYLGGATAVYKHVGQSPEVDKGVLVCSTTGVSVGGACIPFGAGNAIKVDDLARGNQVAFQVCIDNDGDNACTDFGQPPTGDGCLDQLFFSHDDLGNFFNPLGSLPTSWAPTCSGGFPGYVVFLCEGVHSDLGNPGTSHAHPASIGSVTSVNGGTGYGNFCGAGQSHAPPVEKRYVVI